MPKWEKILSDAEIHKITQNKLRNILGDATISSAGKLELWFRIEKIRPNLLINI